MIYKILCEDWETEEQKYFYFDSLTNRISAKEIESTEVIVPFSVSKETPCKKSRTPYFMKIQLGISCNFNCSYCSQKFLAHSETKDKYDVDEFVNKLIDNVDLSGIRKLQFWGGEPLVYWKKLKPLIEKLRPLMPKTNFGIITNGSLLTKEIADFLFDNGFTMSMSHDGPGQHVRGDDPLDTNYEVIDYILEKFKGRFCFGSVLNKQNYSRSKIIEFFMNKFPKRDIINFSEMGYVVAYSDDSKDSINFTHEEMQSLRLYNWLEFKQNPGLFDRLPNQKNVMTSHFNVESHVNDPQGCGLDAENVLVVNMNGDILTCQNTSANTIAQNGESHKIGDITKLDEVKLNTGTHWSRRENCKDCPVLSTCRGSCFFIQDELFASSCEMSYTNLIPLFAVAFESQTGYVPLYICSDTLPESRKNIFGLSVDKFKLPV